MKRLIILVVSVSISIASLSPGALAQRKHSSHTSTASSSRTSSSSSKAEEKRLKAERKREEKGAKETAKAQRKAQKEQEKLAKRNSKDYYINANGHKVHRPIHADSFPDNASGECKDGTFTFSEHKRGACSGHGGVRSWVR